MRKQDLNECTADSKQQELILRLKCLAISFKIDTPLRRILSIPGSSYHNLNKFLTPLFEKSPGANFETSTLDARKELELFVLDDNEQIVSLDVKSFDTNVTLLEAIEVPLRFL